jgi:hypothetical protein
MLNEGGDHAQAPRGITNKGILVNLLRGQGRKPPESEPKARKSTAGNVNTIFLLAVVVVVVVVVGDKNHAAGGCVVVVENGVIWLGSNAGL